MAKGQFVGTGWLKEFDNGGRVVNLSIKKADIEQMPADQYGNVFLVVGKRKEQDPKSKATHWVAVDEYRMQKIKDEGGF